MTIPVSWLWSLLVLTISIGLYVAVLRTSVLLTVVLLAPVAVAVLVLLVQPVVGGQGGVSGLLCFVLLKSLIERPELAEQVHIHLPEADHLLPQERQLTVQVGHLPLPAGGVRGSHLLGVHVHAGN